MSGDARFGVEPKVWGQRSTNQRDAILKETHREGSISSEVANVEYWSTNVFSSFLLSLVGVILLLNIHSFKVYASSTCSCWPPTSDQLHQTHTYPVPFLRVTLAEPSAFHAQLYTLRAPSSRPLARYWSARPRQVVLKM